MTGGLKRRKYGHRDTATQFASEPSNAAHLAMQIASSTRVQKSVQKDVMKNMQGDLDASKTAIERYYRER